ncbi:MAG: ribonuclease P protein component [Bacilli bacterium]|nr:ribonuclease P protein component [Bacilli bacterium]
MKKYEVVKSQADFNDIMNNGHKINNSYYLIFKKANNNNIPLFGIAVGKKIGNAVTRNKIKRQLRMIITKNKMLFKSGFSYIILVKKSCLNLKYQEMEQHIIELMRKETI